MQILPNSINCPKYNTKTNLQFWVLNFCIEKKKEKAVKGFLFNILTLDYVPHEGFMKHQKWVKMIGQVIK